MPSLLLEDVVKKYPRTFPGYSYPGEGAVNPAYQVVEDSCLLRPNEKKIWVLRGDMILAVGIKNADMNLHIGAEELKNAVYPGAEQYLNLNDRSGHPSLAVPEPGYDGSVYLAGWVCQRNDGHIEISLQSGRFNNTLTDEQRDNLELYIARRFMNSYGFRDVIFYDYSEDESYYYFTDQAQPNPSLGRIYTPHMAEELNSIEQYRLACNKLIE